LINFYRREPELKEFRRDNFFNLKQTRFTAVASVYLQIFQKQALVNLVLSLPKLSTNQLTWPEPLSQRGPGRNQGRIPYNAHEKKTLVR